MGVSARRSPPRHTRCESSRGPQLLFRDVIGYNIDMADVVKLLKDYRIIWKLRRIAPENQENYERYLRAFFQNAGVKSIGDINLENIKNFRLALARKEGLKKLLKLTT